MASTSRVSLAEVMWKFQASPSELSETTWRLRQESSFAPWIRSNTAGYSGGGNKFDLQKWNPEYCHRFHDFLTAASDRSIVVEITLFSSHYGDAQWNLSPFHPANNVTGTELADWKKLHTLDNGKILGYQERYTRKLIQEANMFDNVIFEIQNEPWSDRPAPAGTIGVVNPFLQPPARERFPNASETADDLSLAWQAKVAEWITSEEAALPNKHLMLRTIRTSAFLSPSFCLASAS